MGLEGWTSLSHWNTGGPSSCCEELLFFLPSCEHSAHETWHSYRCYLLLHNDQVSLRQTWRMGKTLIEFLAEILIFLDIFVLKIIDLNANTSICWIERQVTFRIMKLGHCVIVDDSDNYVMFHELNVRIKNKKN